jgi:Asp-tRNA(Asn)/Glu-tRNA(Gln) amidotransferase A subunit family amidase
MTTVRLLLHLRFACRYLTDYLDDADLLDGAPVGLQIIGQRLQEETVLALSDEISREFARGQAVRL